MVRTWKKNTKKGAISENNFKLNSIDFGGKITFIK